jgi:hypothetical protein
MLSIGPGTAEAAVCETLRPGWVEGSEATALDEALHQFSSAPALGLLAATLVAVRFRSAWGGLAVTVFWSLHTYMLVFAPGRAATRQAAAADGCVASPALFIAAVTAICIATILYTAPSDGRSPGTGE